MNKSADRMIKWLINIVTEWISVLNEPVGQMIQQFTHKDGQ